MKDLVAKLANSIQLAENCPPTLAEASASFHKSIVDNLYDGVYFVNRARMITYWNHGAEHLTGYTREEVAGRCCSDNILEHVNEQGQCLCFAGCPLRATMEDGKPRETEIYLRHKLGHRVPVSVRATAIRDDLGRIVGAVEVFSDVSAKKRFERRAGELEHLAYCDSLTGVANRRYAELRLQQLIEELQQFGRPVGLILVDADNFKEINDTWGHQAGDRVLQALSKSLAGNLRPNDVVGRWGGDEFLVLLLDANLPFLKTVAERCRALVVTTAFPPLGDDFRVTVSMGATLLLPSDSGASAITRADKLLYESKSSGRNRITFG